MLNPDTTTLKTVKSARMLVMYSDDELLTVTNGEAPSAGTTE